MSMMLEAKFATRREAEMTVERLVQEYAIPRSDIFITSDGDENTVGEHIAGSDSEDGQPSSSTRDDAPLHGQISVSVEIEQDELVKQVRSAFSEFDATSVELD